MGYEYDLVFIEYFSFTILAYYGWSSMNRKLS